MTAINSNSAIETKKQIKTLISQKDIPESVDASRLDELRRIFARLQTSGELNLSLSSAGKSANTSGSTSVSTIKIKWNNWLKKQHGVFLSQLSECVSQGRKSALRTFMGVIASSPLPNGCVSGILMYQLLQALIGDTNTSTMEEGEQVELADGMKELLDKEFIQPYRDVQYTLLVQIQNLAKKVVGESRQHEKEAGNQSSEGNEEEEEDSESVKEGATKVENLMRILLEIEIGEDQESFEPKDVQVDSEGNGNCSNYLFLPKAPSTNNQQENNETDEEADDDDDNVEEHGASSSSEDEYSDNENDKQKSEEPAPKKRKILVRRPPQQSHKQHCSAVQRAFLTILQHPHIPLRTLKRILQFLPNQVLPVVPTPLRFADFCTKAYEMGGIVGVLSLHSLFLLMMECGLEYPSFYKSLYKLVEPKVFYAKYRTRFFKLLVNCLTKSQMLPAYLVAAFCKRLCRCALNAPPSGALFSLALVSNLLRKHPECACLIHRGGGEPMEDSYDAVSDDPAQTRAIESSLWELHALEKHYHPAVATLAKECGKESDKSLMHNLDEFLLHTYKSLFDQERKREKNRKRVAAVPLTFKKPKGLFVKGDTFDGIFDFPIEQD